jgi:hypothetical protein
VGVTLRLRQEEREFKTGLGYKVKLSQNKTKQINSYHAIISVDSDNVFDKIQHAFMIKKYSTNWK